MQALLQFSGTSYLRNKNPCIQYRILVFSIQNETKEYHIQNAMSKLKLTKISMRSLYVFGNNPITSIFI